jgi:hypothetical protein
MLQRRRDTLAALMRTLTFGAGASMLAAVVTLNAASMAPPQPQPPYDAADTAAWREKREQDLRSATGWLSVAGLFFLKPGANTIGSDRARDIPLPPGSAPPIVGSIVNAPDGVWLEPAANAGIIVNDRPVASRVKLEGSDRASAGRIIFHLHHSGDRLAIRVRDPESALRREFRGLRWYPIDPSWRIAGRYLPYAAPRPVILLNVLGDEERFDSPGEVELNVNGKTIRMQPVTSGERLWFIFTDRTADRETYRIRFLYAAAPSASGAVVLDFNRAYNPPCAYNPYTTCPLPPRQNRLDVAIEAGEKSYRGSS